MIYLSQPTEYTTLRVNYNGNMDFVVLCMMCQYKFINFQKCTTFVDGDNGRDYSCVGLGGMREIFVPSPKFC